MRIDVYQEIVIPAADLQFFSIFVCFEHKSTEKQGLFPCHFVHYHVIQVSHPSFPTTDLTDFTDSSCAWAFNYTGFSKITAAKAAIAFHILAGKSL